MLRGRGLAIVRDALSSILSQVSKIKAGTSYAYPNPSKWVVGTEYYTDLYVEGRFWFGYAIIGVYTDELVFSPTPSSPPEEFIFMDSQDRELFAMKANEFPYTLYPPRFLPGGLRVGIFAVTRAPYDPIVGYF